MTTSFVGRRVPAETLRIRKEPLRLPLLLLIPWWLLKLAVRLLLAIAGSPVAVITLAALTLTWAVCQLGHPLYAVAGFLVLAGALVAIRFRWPAFFERWIRLPLRSRWRRWSIYRYKWPATMDFAELNRYRSNGTQYEPVLLTVKSTRDLDRVRARMLAGQVVEDWGKVSDRLCQTFGADDCRVRSVPGRPHEIEAWFLINDPLQQVIQPHPQEVPVRLDGLPIGLGEDGEVYRLPLLGSHVLTPGETGSGKSALIWSIIYQLAPAIADGTVQLWGIDPKAMELAAGEPLFARMAYLDPAHYAQVLEDAVVVMRARQIRLRGITRLHQPSQAEPLIVILIDELAALSYVNERDLRRRIDNALGLLLSQGRAVGITVIGAIQDPRKETLPARDLFPVRIALRLAEADQVRLILGPGTRDRGARCDEIPHSLPGVGFVQIDGLPEPVRVRFAFVTDDHIRMLAAGWRPPTPLSGIKDDGDEPDGMVAA
jgi:DNA segregation ATPase FtsK/SpoIIIE, S-DNA-T family